MTTHDWLAAVRARAEKATKGPWMRTDVEEGEGNVCITHAHHDIFRQQATTEVLRSEPGIVEAKVEQDCVNVGCYLGERDDADFIAHAREDVPRLLAALTECTRALEKACAIIELGDRRLLASDGPAGGQPPELSLAEWRELYVTLDTARKSLPGAPLQDNR